MNIAGAIVSIGGASLIAANILLSQTAYSVLQIYDGDTFDTTEKQRIRLNGINAPELGMCGSEDAKKQLETLILNKKLYIKVVYTDTYNRLIANVYTKDGIWVNYEMAKRGLAVVEQKTKSDPKMIEASQLAITNSIGIYGTSCTQMTNNNHPSCFIKGNVNASTGQKIYHLKGCNAYTQVKVQLFQGDRWFCTEKEAQQEGFTKAITCP
jgi:micrococcal nuclease